jgi:glycosyltransferase involved in cell wall biosynthesis
LQSLIGQTFSAFEVIVCDDGSTDQTQDRVDQFKHDLNLRYRYQEHQGFRAAAARNMGLKLARGKVIVFLDSDLIVPATFLEAHWQAHQGKQKWAVNSYVYRMKERDDTYIGLSPEDYIADHSHNLKGDSRDRYHLFERGKPVAETYFLDSNALSMKREDIQQIGGFDPEFIGWGHEDTELGYRLSKNGFMLLLIKDKATSYHQYHDFSETKEDERAENWARLTQKHGIERWYHPLWNLPVEASVYLQLENNTAIFLSPLQTGRFDLAVGQKIPWDQFYRTITMRDSIVTEIE